MMRSVDGSMAHTSPANSFVVWNPLFQVLKVVVILLNVVGHAQGQDGRDPQDAIKGLEIFERSIRPTFIRHCIECHHQDNREGGLALDCRPAWMKGGDSGPCIVPDRPQESLLLRAIRHDEPGLEMPSKAPKLSLELLRDFEEWIQLGAPDPRDAPEVATMETIPWSDLAKERAQWWCWRPLPKNLPSRSVSEAIDDCIDRKLVEASIERSERADRPTLLRRASFQLRGLPPTPDELRRFLEDNSANAWEKCIDRLLETREFGEHWARHWMDVVRYADTHGSEDDALLPFAYRYRDYLVRAFEQDLPFDQLILEHLAGDQISPRWNETHEWNESLIGLAFLRFVEFNQTPVDVKREEVIVIDNQIDAIGKAFQAMTISCARCHDHKFDPISDEDYYAIYGILRSSRAAMRIIDDTTRFSQQEPELEALQSQITSQVFEHWRSRLDRWPQEIEHAIDWCRQRSEDKQSWEQVQTQLPDSPWTQALAKAVWKPDSSPLSKLAPLLLKDARERAPWEPAMKDLWRQLTSPAPLASSLPAGSHLLFDLSDGTLEPFRALGAGLPMKGITNLTRWSIQGSSDHLFAALLEFGYHTNTLSDRSAGSIRSPDFVVEGEKLSVLARGANQARVRVVIENFQGDSLLFDTINPHLDSRNYRWYTMTIRPQWRGLRAHLELLTRDDKPYIGVVKEPESLESSDGRSSFGLVMAVGHPANVRLPELPAFPREWEKLGRDGELSWRREDWIRAIIDSTRHCIERLDQHSSDDRDRRWINAWLQASILPYPDSADDSTKSFVRQYRDLESKIPKVRRSPGVVDDGPPVDQAWMPRGDHKRASDLIARRYLDILGSTASDYPSDSSGRLQLARELIDPENPLTARVYVNRIWHWLFGAGLVTTVDNFGRMGEPPSHPDLLDELSVSFLKNGWSTKSMVRGILLSEAWQRSSLPTSSAREKDPGNRLWSHATIRRLDAESIRDTLLFVTNDLRRGDSGLGTRNYYRTVFDPNKQAPPGPIDGDRRRSIYLEVRRNFPYDFLTTFDFPRPTAPAGRRNRTIVPGQSLALLNDPLVVYQAKRWAERLLGEYRTDRERIDALYWSLLSRPPNEAEHRQAVDYLDSVSDRHQAWVELTHAMFNLKESIFLR